MMDFSKVHTGEETYADVVRRWKAGLPPGHPSLKSLSEICQEQGTTPIDYSTLRDRLSFWLYEGFEEDVLRLRRGLAPIGPRE